MLKNIITLKLFALSFLTLAGCDKIQDIVDRPGYEKFEELCQKDAGTFIYSKPQVSGYLDETTYKYVWVEMVKRGFDFIEVGIDEEDFRLNKILVSSRDNLPEYKGKPLKLFTETGYWRISKVPIESGECNKLLFEQTRQLHLGDEMKAYNERGCFKVEKVDSIISEYVHRSELKQVHAAKKNTTIVRFWDYIENINSGNVMAERIEYIWTPGVNVGLFGSAFPGRGKNCFSAGFRKGPSGPIVNLVLFGDLSKDGGDR